ncbi:MAG TPA: Asp-tRNA(Asn)/Glu-tRNA(Gln) amidotransferase subunit GatA [Candidatus Kapabacteria bacterium]|nr:Asp-tRNA(Asn)/Glu-tRNA(Gln) amidotransferase subunit GatA [Candidatus Kapabacteria bacterium]
MTLYEIASTRNAELNCFLEIFDEACFPAHDGPLSDMTVAVKDVLALKGARLTCGSKFLENFTSLYTATCVQRLIDAGARIVGKTNMDEFAMGSSNENSAYGPVKNPWDETRVPGGSSGGSAVAAAIGACDVALGTDTGGSIRQPAAFCGVVGMKPTYGRISRYGLTAFASSFDTVGTFSRSLEDAARALEIMAGFDEMDSTSARVPVPKYSDALARDVKGLTIGIPKEYFGEGIEPDVRMLVEESKEKLRKAGCKIIDVSLPHSKYCVADYYILTTAEASSNLARFDGIRYGRRATNYLVAQASSPVPGAGVPARTPALQNLSLEETYRKSRTEGFGREVKRRIMLGTYVLSSGYYDAYYTRAQKVRRLIAEDFLTAFQSCDALLTPTTPTTAFKLGEKVSDPLAMYLNDIFTVSANIAGVPAMSVPVGLDANRLPVGAQLIARHFEEETLFALGKEIIAGMPVI